MEETNKETTSLPKAIVMYSNNAGHSPFLKHREEVESSLSAIFDLTFIETKSMEEGERIARESCGKYDTLILYGGDGTLNNIINTLSKCESAPKLAYLGGGTLNDGGKNFGVKNLKSGLSLIQNGHVGEFDVISSGEQSFFYLGGFGAYMDVSYIAKRKVKKLLGRLTYYILCIGEMFKIQKHKVKISNEDGLLYEGKVCSLSVLNGKWLGGMKVNAKGSLNDGVADILIVKPRLFNGFIRYVFHKGFVRLSGRKLHIELEKDLPWCFDGEKGPSGSLDLEVKNKCIKAYCNPKVLM